MSLPLELMTRRPVLYSQENWISGSMQLSSMMTMIRLSSGSVMLGRKCFSEECRSCPFEIIRSRDPSNCSEKTGSPDGGRIT